MKSPKQQLGSRGEVLARSYLEGLGLQFVASNWSCKAGELDLIMQDQDVRVIVEVRLRQPTSYGFGFETVGPQKQAKLIRATQWYQQQEDYWDDIRFDVISIVDIPNGTPEIDHIKDAFTL